jgi:MYXO-CTERM domain-containing protein
VSSGGFPAPGGYNDWDFQGGDSEPDGLYVHGLGSPHGDGNPDFAFDKIAKGGVWTFEFEQTWGTADWKGVSIALHKQSAIPAPGALALLGLAGLVGARRRRP